MTTTFDFQNLTEKEIAVLLDTVLEVIKNPDTPASTLEAILEKTTAKNIIESIKSKIEEAIHIAMQRKNSTDIITFDFGDGNGAVPAHRHRNPDGSLGGWVADTAFVEKTATVGHSALVFGNAVVNGKSVITDTAKIYDEAFVCDNARIYGKAKIYGDAFIFGSLNINQNVDLLDDKKIKYESFEHYDVTDDRSSSGCSDDGEIQISKIRQIIAKGKIQGYLTYNEVDECLLYDSTNPEDIKEIINMIMDMGIKVVEFAPEDEIESLIPIVKESVQQSTGFKIPPPPEPLQFNTQRISEIKTESKKVSAMLNAIYEQDEITPVTINTEQSTPETTQPALNLDAAHLEIVKILATRSEWERNELQKMMKGMMIDGVLEHINDAFFDYCEEAFIEGEDPVEINVELYKEIFK
jgi:hypothetical protein